MRSQFKLLSGAAIALLLFSACSDSDDDSGNGVAGSGNSTQEAGAGGQSGNAGTAGQAGTAGAAGEAGASGAAGTAGAAGSSGNAGEAGAAGVAGSAGEAGAAGASGAAGTAGSAGSGNQPLEVTVNDTVCFDLAAGTSDTSADCTSGDLLFMVGLNVDLASQDFNSPAWCAQPGTHSDLSTIPDSYAGCDWVEYVEGAEGLANTGYIVRDKAAAHHYKFQVVSNTLPILVFRYVKID